MLFHATKYMYWLFCVFRGQQATAGREESPMGELPAASGCNYRRSHIPVMVPAAYHLPHIKWRILIELPWRTRIGHFIYFMTWFHATWCFSMLRSTHFKGFMYFVTCIEIGSGSTVTSFPFLTSQWCQICLQMLRNWQCCNEKTAWNDTVVEIRFQMFGIS